MFSVIKKLLSVHENLPLGLFELSPQHTPSLSLRSASGTFLDVPGPKTSKTKRYGLRPFRCIVPFQYISANELNTFYSTLVDEVIAVIKTESTDLCSLNVLIIRH